MSSAGGPIIDQPVFPIVVSRPHRIEDILRRHGLRVPAEAPIGGEDVLRGSASLASLTLSCLSGLTRIVKETGSNSTVGAMHEQDLVN